MGAIDIQKELLQGAPFCLSAGKMKMSNHNSEVLWVICFLKKAPGGAVRMDKRY